MVKFNSTKRFSNRVGNYVKYRPHYPNMVLNILKEKIQISSNQIIADIGSGTGILTELFLKIGNIVYGVEPNKEMREAAENLLKDYNNFRSINGTAEKTLLESKSVDLITAGQAFHWFNVEKARIEFLRILKPKGYVILLWNTRLPDTTPFSKEYENLLRKYGTDYTEVHHTNIEKNVFSNFFMKDSYQYIKLDNYQLFDFDSLKGRLLSSSYIPTEESSHYLAMIEDLKQIYETYQENNGIKFEYVTELYYGQLS